MLLEGRSGVTRMPFNWLAVTQMPSRNIGGAATGDSDATLESVSCRSAGRAAIVASAGGGSRLPYCLHATAWCGSETPGRLPARWARPVC